MPPLHGESPFVSAGERPPRLVLRFALFTALGVAAAAAVILVVVRHTDTARAHGQAIDRARFAARAVLGPQLRAADLSARPAARRKRELDRLFAGRVLLEGIRAATLYGPNGRATYSTLHARMIREEGQDRVRSALAGTLVSEVATAEDGSRVLRTYVPIGVGPGRVEGVVALDQEYAQIEAAVRRSSWLIAGVLEGMLLLLFLIFAPLLAKVSSRIRRHVEELDYVATHDELTGLPNRLALRRAGGHVLATDGSGALVLVDVDGFSEVNDCLGSQSGDALLAQVAQRLRDDIPDHAFVARLGEDEFGILLQAADHEQIEALSQRVRQSLSGPFVVDGIRVAVSVSIGAALLPEHGPDLGTGLRHAGAALSTAKVDGEQSVQVYDPAHHASDTSRLAYTAELREAVDGGQLLLYFQPQADLMLQRIRGVEALLRWEHPRRGLLTAGEFISYVERSGLVRDVRQFTLETSARQWHEWNAAGIDLELAVNLAAVDMLDVALPDEIAELIERYEIPPWNLVLEITERMLIGDERRARHVIDRLAQIGVRLAIDDFGTGYSSLASLRRFPVQQVKLDRSLLAGVPGDAGAEAIVGGSVEIAHGLGATVVAEGIETGAQWRFAFLMGCDIAQGYLIGPPAPADELTALLDAPRLVPLAAV